MADTICPRCGFKQDGGQECHRCGIVFARYRQTPAIPSQADPPLPPVRQTRPPAGLLLRTCRVLRWCVLAGLILVLVLILRPSSPPAIEIPPDAADRAQAKVQEFQAAAQRGRAETLALNQPEINGWLQRNLDLKRPAREDPLVQAKTVESALDMARRSAAPSAEAATVEQIQSTVRDVRIELTGDSLRAFVAFDLYGKDLSLELEGRLEARDGYLRLAPTAGKLGSLPLPAGSLDAAAARLFDSPQNKEKFRLPPHIQDVRVEGGELVISAANPAIPDNR
jgi:hypothetical protein